MQSLSLVTCIVLGISWGCCHLSSPIMAYVGPGAGLSAIGALLAIVAGTVIAIFGFLWYPIKRLLRHRKPSDHEADKGGEIE